MAPDTSARYPLPATPSQGWAVRGAGTGTPRRTQAEHARRSAGQDRLPDAPRSRTERRANLQDAGYLAGDLLPLSRGGQCAYAGALINAPGEST